MHPLPPLLHNQPERIAGEVERAGAELRQRYDAVAVGYADCGTYGALDEVCERLGLRRLPGLHCYDVFARRRPAARRSSTTQPGTYVLTDFLVRSFDRTVVRRARAGPHPELRDDYFAHYTRVVWLAQEPDAELHALAPSRPPTGIGLPLTVVDTGHAGLERALADLSRLVRSHAVDQRAGTTRSRSPPAAGRG